MPAQQQGRVGANGFARTDMSLMIAEFQSADPGSGMMAAPLVTVATNKSTFPTLSEDNFLDDEKAFNYLDPISDHDELPLDGFGVTENNVDLERFPLGALTIPDEVANEWIARGMNADAVASRRFARRGRDIHTVKVSIAFGDSANYDATPVSPGDLNDDTTDIVGPVSDEVNGIILDTGFIPTAVMYNPAVEAKLRINKQVRSTSRVSGAGDGGYATPEQVEEFWRSLGLTPILNRQARKVGGTQVWAFGDHISIFVVDTAEDADSFMKTASKSEAQALGEVWTETVFNPRGTRYYGDIKFDLVQSPKHKKLGRLLPNVLTP